MKQAIVICTHEYREHWCKNLLDTLKGLRYPVFLFINTKKRDRFELGAIKHAYKQGFDEFVLLQDSVEVKDIYLFDMLFKSNKGWAMSLCNHPYHFGCYLGKYRLETLKELEIPEVKNKLEAVEQEEVFTRNYVSKEKKFKPLFVNFGTNTTVFVEKFGEKRMVLENPYFIKYKGTWNRDMI